MSLFCMHKFLTRYSYAVRRLWHGCRSSVCPSVCLLRMYCG